MTSLRDRPNTALLVVDVQNSVVARAYRRDEVIAHTNMYWSWQTGPGRHAEVVETAAVTFAAGRHEVPP
jgi:nicotinamidase-related amidase